MASSPSSSLIPAHLIVGFESNTMMHAYAFLQKALCAHQCNTCHTCQLIKNHQHPAVTWLLPERWYTRDTLQPLFSRIAFSLEQHEPHFFILPKADRLLPHAANSLLKSLEEPPAGYQFLLLAEHLEAVLATIRSRCMISFIQEIGDKARAPNPLVKLFVNGIPTPSNFVTAFEKTNPSEQESDEIFQYLLQHWQQKLKDALTKNKKNDIASHMHNALCHTLKRPIPSGSSKLVWKNFYMQLIR